MLWNETEERVEHTSNERGLQQQPGSGGEGRGGEGRGGEGRDQSVGRLGVFAVKGGVGGMGSMGRE